MVPLTLLAAVSWAAFWFEPVGLQPQISTCMAALIALVAFNFAVDFALPKVDELTLIDRHALIGFGFVAAAVVVVTLVHVAVTRDRLPVARSIQRVARWAFPPAYVLAVAAEPVSFARPRDAVSCPLRGDPRGRRGRRATPLAGGAPMVQDGALGVVPSGEWIGGSSMIEYDAHDWRTHLFDIKGSMVREIIGPRR